MDTADASRDRHGTDLGACAWPVGKGMPEEVTAAWGEAVLSYTLAKEECTIAQIRLNAALLYQKRGELLRQAETIRRQEQHCERCGHQFNYDTYGKPKKPADWCRPDKRLCNKKSKGTFNPDCLASQGARAQGWPARVNVH